MIKRERLSLQDNFSTFSFKPLVLTLYKDDLLKLIDLTNKDFPKVDIQFGRKKLENSIHFQADVESLASREGNEPVEYSLLYISLHTSTSAMIAANLILDIQPNTCSLYVFDRADEKLVSLAGEIKKVLRSRDPYRFFRNRFVSILVYIIDSAYIFYTIFLKDMLEKSLNYSMPDWFFLAFVLLCNCSFLIPHPKNKIFLKNKKEVSIFKKYREMAVMGGLLFLIAVSLVLIVLKLIKTI